MTSESYLARFRDIVRECRWPETTTPAGLLDRWRALVTAAEDGYRWTLEEYDNELSARDVLEAVFADPLLKDEPDVQELLMRVTEVDERLRRLLQDGVEVGGANDPWWRRGVLRFAGPDYVEDVGRIYGIRVAAK